MISCWTDESGDLCRQHDHPQIKPLDGVYNFSGIISSSGITGKACGDLMNQKWLILGFLVLPATVLTAGLFSSARDLAVGRCNNI